MEARRGSDTHASYLVGGVTRSSGGGDVALVAALMDGAGEVVALWRGVVDDGGC